MTNVAVEPAAVSAWLADREPIYRVRQPHYLVTMISDFAAQWDNRHRRLIDVGGGTGLIAQCIADHLHLPQVETIDIFDRFRPDLTVRHSVFDGVHLPFPDGSFEAATLFNVLHHVPVASRLPLLTEIRRVVGAGPIYVKDHLSSSSLDDVRLTALDYIGNLPFGGMVRASYLRREEWTSLAAATGQTIVRKTSGAYRAGAMAALFPNRLEVFLQFEKASSVSTDFIRAI
jgi:ubiquinone/menaquinone biosynthesis C-methylase UbiE